MLTVEQEIAATAANSAEKFTPNLLGDSSGFQFQHFDQFRGWYDSFMQGNQKKYEKFFGNW